jgi:hypothetical protein
MLERSVGWLQKLNPLDWWNRPSNAKPAIPRFNKAPVQGELSLDNIKVVRNDLSDTDVEVVPARVIARPKADAKAKPEPETNVHETGELIKT